MRYVVGFCVLVVLLNLASFAFGSLHGFSQSEGAVTAEWTFDIADDLSWLDIEVVVSNGPVSYTGTQSMEIDRVFDGMYRGDHFELDFGFNPDRFESAPYIDFFDLRQGPTHTSRGKWEITTYTGLDIRVLDNTFNEPWNRDVMFSVLGTQVPFPNDVSDPKCLGREGTIRFCHEGAGYFDPLRTIPEPSSFVLFAISGLAWLGLRRYGR